MTEEKKEKITFRQKIAPYRQAVTPILQYQLVSKILLAVLLYLLNQLFIRILESSGRVAVSSGDLGFLFTTWQGILMPILGLAVLVLYTVFDINAMIILADELLQGKKPSFVDYIRKSLLTIPRIFSLRGLIIILYIALLAPLVNIGISITLTNSLYIPTFITSVIEETPSYSILYHAVLILFSLIGIIHIFCMHGIVLDNMSVRDSARQSRQMIRAHWLNFIIETLKIEVIVLLYAAFYVVLFMVLPLLLLSLINPEPDLLRFFTVLFCLAGSLVIGVAGTILVPFNVMKITQLYETYKNDSVTEYPIIKKRKRTVLSIGITILFLLFVITSSVMITYFFDLILPDEVNTQIVAHRAGGNEGVENTVSGIEAAASHGAWGSEIDIQRTKDGYYVVNHDNTFKRVAGVNKKPSQMTLEEVRELHVHGEPVPTLQEMLEASRDNVILLIELKGETADIQMAEDAVRIVKEMDMQDQAIIISLKYNLIQYIEKNYPEMETGYLAFFSFGKTADLDCDYLSLEEEVATAQNIDAIHENGKKVLIWTPNNRNSQYHFLLSKADGIITDNIVQASDITREITNRDDFTKIMDFFFIR